MTRLGLPAVEAVDDLDIQEVGPLIAHLSALLARAACRIIMKAEVAGETAPRTHSPKPRSFSEKVRRGSAERHAMADSPALAGWDAHGSSLGWSSTSSARDDRSVDCFTRESTSVRPTTHSEKDTLTAFARASHFQPVNRKESE